MLIQLNNPEQCAFPETEVGTAAFPQPFAGTLEYNAPVRGPWNIVHTGMLLPQSHQIYVCAAGCLRGVVMTAAEMQAMDRMSWVAVDEADMFNGQLEENIISGASEIIARLPKRPRAILLFISCIHQFAGCDMARVIAELGARHSGIDFVDCYMTPTMRKSGLTPDQLVRRQIYALLPKVPPRPQTAAIIGNDRPTMPSSELIALFGGAGWTVRDLTQCASYDDFLDTADSSLYITTSLPAKAAAESLAARTGRMHLHLPLCYGDAEIRRYLRELSLNLQMTEPDWDEAAQKAESALAQLRSELSGWKVAIDYTATPRPLGLARRLLECGIDVSCVYADVFSPEEQGDFEAIRGHFPKLRLRPTVHPSMLHAPPQSPSLNCLAIGQKAAWFENTPYFVNIVAGGGQWGFDGICRLAAMMGEAAGHPKDTATLIQHKGLGCRSCIWG